MAQLISGVRQRFCGLAQRVLPDSLFGQLACLVAVAVVLSHALAVALLSELNPWVSDPHLSVSPGLLVMDLPIGLFHVGLLLDISVRLVALVLAAWVGARWLSQPLRKLGRAAKELGRDIHRPAMPEDGTRECRQAARLFNQMQQRIRQRLAQRDQFVAAVSHDLRTPLTRLALRAQALPDSQAQQSFGKDIMEMDDMIRTTLDYVRGMACAEPATLLDVGSLLSSLAQDFQDGGQDVQLHGGMTAAPLLAQASALRRCVGNLVDNAVRYGQRARISLTEGCHQLQICVHDDGPGIPAQELDKVLTPFYRVESSCHHNRAGVGLGLATAHEIAQKHGGSLKLSNPKSGGLMATLSLPRRVPSDH